jgi:hypothetical protein
MYDKKQTDAILRQGDSMGPPRAWLEATRRAEAAANAAEDELREQLKERIAARDAAAAEATVADLTTKAKCGLLLDDCPFQVPTFESCEGCSYPADKLHELAGALRGVQDRLRPIAIAQEQREGEPVEGSRRLERLRQCYTELSVLIGHMEQIDG